MPGLSSSGSYSSESSHISASAAFPPHASAMPAAPDVRAAVEIEHEYKTDPTSADRIEEAKSQLDHATFPAKKAPQGNGDMTYTSSVKIDGTRIDLSVTFTRKDIKALKKEAHEYLKSENLPKTEFYSKFKELERQKIFDKSVQIYCVWEMHSSQSGVTAVEMWDKDVIQVLHKHDVVEEYGLYNRVTQLTISKQEEDEDPVLAELNKNIDGVYKASAQEVDEVSRKYFRQAPRTQQQQHMTE